MIKTGIDIVINKRFEKLKYNESFLEKVFHISELKNRKKLIAIFALKEAVIKCLGKKVNWKDIEVKIKEGKKSEIFLSKNIQPKNFKNIDGSISHDGEYTIAFVIMELK